MSDKMSQNEIDMLISQIGEETGDKAKESSSNNKTGKSNSKAKTTLYREIDFRKPNKLQEGNLGALKQIHENFSKSINNYLTMSLRCSIQADVDFDVIEQLTYKQYTNINNKSFLWGMYETSEAKDSAKCFIQIPTSFCDFFIDRSFGGNSDFNPIDDNEEKKIAEINKEVLKKLFSNILDIYQQAWDNSNIVDYKISLTSIEDNVQNLNLGVTSSEMMLIIPIEISIFQKLDEEDEGVTQKTLFKIAIPYSVIEPVLDKLNISNILSSHISESENEDVKSSIQGMNNIVEAYVAETKISFEDLLKLEEEDIISFEKKKQSPYSIYIGGIKKYEAMPYKQNDKICLKIIK